jgi:hypothetical protein
MHGRGQLRRPAADAAATVTIVCAASDGWDLRGQPPPSGLVRSADDRRPATGAAGRPSHRATPGAPADRRARRRLAGVARPGTRAGVRNPARRRATAGGGGREELERPIERRPVRRRTGHVDQGVGVNGCPLSPEGAVGRGSSRPSETAGFVEERGSPAALPLPARRSFWLGAASPFALRRSQPSAADRHGSKGVAAQRARRGQVAGRRRQLDLGEETRR